MVTDEWRLNIILQIMDRVHKNPTDPNRTFLELNKLILKFT